MGFIIKGNLSGYLCDDCIESVSNVKIRIYSPETTADITAAAVAATKDTFKSLTDAQIEVKSKRLIAEGLTNETGNFEITMGSNYKGGAFDIDFTCGNVPRKPPKPKLDFKVRQFHLTTLFPQWKEVSSINEKVLGEVDYVYGWKYTLPTKIWCFIRGYYFDAWTICGRLLNCETKKPLTGLTVVAMDADFITDDHIGSGVTDSTGNFRIDYSSIDFKKTFLSPLINIETDINFPFASGPDVYFQIEYGGNTIPFETASDRRNNVGYCLCVDLCLKENISELSIPASFSYIGRRSRIHIQTGINATTGKTASNDHAFYNAINLIGSLNTKFNGQPMEYMFEYQEVTNPSDPLTGIWSPVTPNMIGETLIGSSWILTGDIANPIEWTNYYINKSSSSGVDVAFNGNWIQMPQVANFAANVGGDILNLKTDVITGVRRLNMAGMTIGLPTVNGARPHTLNKFVAIRMKQKEVGSAASGSIAGTSRPIAIFNVLYDNVPKRGSWAPQLVSDQLAAVSMDIQEITGGAVGCKSITNTLNVKYNARHENLGTVGLEMYGPGVSSPNFAPIILANPEVSNTVNPIISVAGLVKCAYTVFLTVTVKLTTGDSEPGPIQDFISFCKD